jgi:hypothetical protein
MNGMSPTLVEGPAIGCLPAVMGFPTVISLPLRDRELTIVSSNVVFTSHKGDRAC